MTRLSELLERIRPAGVPGAAGEAGPGGARPVDAELLELVHELEQFDRAADAIVDAARSRAALIESDADRRVEAVRAGVAERVAVAAADDGVPPEAAAERDRIVADAGRTVEVLRRDQDARRDRAATRAVEIVWSWVDGTLDQTSGVAP